MPFLIHYGGLHGSSFIEKLKKLGFFVDLLGGGVYILKTPEEVKDDRHYALEKLANLPKDYLKKVKLSYIPSVEVLDDNDILFRSLANMQSFEKTLEELLLLQKDTILDSLYAVFQPIVNLNEGFLYGFEALCRGKISIPYLVDFAKPLLETVDWTCREDALKKKAAFNIPPNIKLFLNFFPESLQNIEKASKYFFQLLEKYKISPEEIVVEITEYAGFDIEKLKDLVQQWRSLGMKIALDDVGRGEDSLFRFLELTPDIVKIDMVFIRDIHENRIKRDITRYLINLAHSNNMLVVVEGIEKVEELRVVKDLGADLVQGWLIGKPTTEPQKYLKENFAAKLKKLL